MTRSLFFALTALTAIAAGPSVATAQTYPNKPVRIIVPFSPATAADIVTRQLGSKLAEIWGQGVVIENQGGAGGMIGAANAARAAPELVALAKARSMPIQYGSGGNGSITHLALELLKARTSIDMTHVPYKGVAQMISDVLGNQIPLACPAVATALGQVKAGKLKALAITSAKRSSVLPEVPTVAETGILDYDVSAWNGLLAPARASDELVAKIHADVAKVAQSKDFVEQLQAQALEVDLLRPAEFRAFLAAEIAKWSKLVKDSGAKLD